MKTKDITMSSHVCLSLWINFDSKENDGRKGFTCKTEASISFILMRKTSFWLLIMKRIEIFKKNPSLSQSMDEL